MCVHMLCECVCACLCVQVSSNTGRGVRFPGAEVTGSCMPQLQVLQNKLPCPETPLRHLSRIPNSFCITCIQEKFQQYRMLNYCLDPDNLILKLFSTCLCFQTLFGSHSLCINRCKTDKEYTAKFIHIVSSVVSAGQDQGNSRQST